MPEDWELKSAGELLELKICDPAMGSGAFLVQACRWLSDRLVEAWSVTEKGGKLIDSEGRILDDGDAAGFEPLSQDPEERAILARRLIAERCLYGVDRNPLAVELAKLSLWLTTMSKGRPFGFLDHNLRSGDSLLGIHDIRQLTELSMAPKGSKQLRLFGRSIHTTVEKAIALRMRLRSIPIRDIRDVEAMAALDADSRKALLLPQAVADAFVGIILAESRTTNSAHRLQALEVLADAATNGTDAAVDRLRRDTIIDLRIGSSGGVTHHPFHWPLEFPEVFQKANSGFDAIIGNPPFLGNRLWKGASGDSLTDIARMLLGKAPGKIDLSVVFHRRAADLLSLYGTYGMLASTSISEGSAVSSGLAQLIKLGAIVSADKNLPWPGSASISIAIVVFFKGDWLGTCIIDNKKCKVISAKLEVEAVDAGSFEPGVIEDSLFAFEGVNNSKGLAFLLDPQNEWFSRLSKEENNLLVPYVSGDDITSAPLMSPKRWCLDIGDRSLQELEAQWPVASKFITEVVKPTRSEETLTSYKGLYNRWWQFWNHRADQMRRLRMSERCFVLPKVAMQLQGVPSTTRSVFTNKVLVVGLEEPFIEALLHSSVFRIWIEEFCSGTLGRVACYTLTVNAMQIMPRPVSALSLSGLEAATHFSELIARWCQEREVGARALHNELANETSSDKEIIKLRSLLHEINKDVFQAYGMEPPSQAYGTFKDKVGSTYFGLNRSYHQSVLRTLLEINENQKKR